jgi:phosphoglycerol transferase MdoB-like AlkP superfamily enzyme
MNFRSTHFTRNLIFSLLLIVVALVVFLISAALYSINTARGTARTNRAYITCVLNWANESTYRTSTLTPLSQQRQHAFDKVFRDFSAARNPNPTPAEQKALRIKFFHDFDAWQKATDRYDHALKTHPVPKSPKLACANVKK